MGLRIIQVDVGLAEEDPRNLAARAGLIEALQTHNVEVVAEGSTSTAKGIEEILLAVITSTTTIPAVVAAFRAWLDRPQHRSVTIQEGDQRIVIDADKVRDGTLGKIVANALEANSSDEK
jgi:hypothetical protein